MRVGKKQTFILFTLGQYYVQANEKLKKLPLEIVISKKVFIDIVRKANIAEKKERALYRNLETLEKKKLISYDNRNLKLTPRGQKMFTKLNREYGPYLNLAKVLDKVDMRKYTTKAQTVFK
jgi:coproporphyrinogen III oxidase-like Fe-S oxidoreductase